MMRALPIAAALMLAGCATSDWARMQEEFPEVRENCGVPGVELQRDAGDRRLLHLVYPHRSDMISQTERDGRLACFEHWASERGFRLVTAGANGPQN